LPHWRSPIFVARKATAALLLIFIVPHCHDFRRLAAWWAFIALIHNPFMVAGYSLW
jgi:hypothetical protein